MKALLSLVSFVLLALLAFGQTDTTSTTKDSNTEVYDVVAVYRDHIDGRGRTRKFTSEIKGSIIKYDESTGVLTFKGIDGRMYSFSSDEYEYFQYDKEFVSKKKRKKKEKVLNPRKDSGLEISIGLSPGVLNIPTGFEADDNFVGGLTAGFESYICLKGGVSKYLNINSSVGLTAEYSMLNAESTYFNVGPRYQYIYNPAKNAALYFPLALKFAHYRGEHYYQIDETVYTNDGSYWPKELEADVTLNSLELNIGQGISFALKNKRSISLELMLFNQFILSEKIKLDSSVNPITNYRANGVRLSVFMNF